MSNKPKLKEKRIPKTKSELIAELRKSSVFVEQMKFAKEVFYPALLDIDTNVDDLKQFMSSITTVMMEKVVGKMKEMKISDIKLVECLDSKDPNYDKYVKLFKLFEDKSLYEVRTAFESMKSEIDTFMMDENRNRKLSSIKCRWLDEL